MAKYTGFNSSVSRRRDLQARLYWIRKRDRAVRTDLALHEILLESGGTILLESGGKLLLET